MTDITRRGLLAGTGALVLGTAFHTRARAAEFTYKFANNMPLTHPVNIRVQEAADAIYEETDGRFAINIFPSDQLGNYNETLSQLRSGAIELNLQSNVVLSQLVPSIAITGIGFAFPDYPTVWRAMDGELGAYTRAEIEKKGLLSMDKIWDNGFRQITNGTKPVNSPDDLRGMKIRVPGSPLWQSMFTAFGSAPTTITSAELYTALSTGIVDGQENALSLITLLKLYEVQSHCAMTGHMWDGFNLLVNPGAWAALPESIQEIVAQHLNAKADEQRADMEAINTSARDELEKNGMAFTMPDASEFRAKLVEAGFYNEWKDRLGEGPWSLLEQAVDADLG